MIHRQKRLKLGRKSYFIERKKNVHFIVFNKTFYGQKKEEEKHNACVVRLKGWHHLHHVICMKDKTIVTAMHAVIHFCHCHPCHHT